MKLDAAYFCVRPYQIMTAISIMRSKGERADLYISPSFANADEYTENIKKLNIFESVKLVNSKTGNKYFKSKSPLLNRIDILKSYLNADKIAKEILIEDRQYDKIYASGKSFIYRMVQNHYLKHKIPVEFIRFDDGEGSYDNEKAFKPASYDIKLQKLLYGSSIDTAVQTVLLHYPDLYYAINPESTTKVKKIDSNWDKQTNTINALFGIDSSCKFSESAIILDMMKSYWFDEQGTERYLNLYRKIVETLGYENVVIKKHPHDYTDDIEGIKYFSKDYNSVPFEVICLNSQMNSKVLIAYSSTAVITPALMFNQEPYVILLYKLVESKLDLNGKQDLLYSKVKETYKNPDKFLIPETVDELVEFLNSIKSDLK